jgi:F-type H+-transporting ATPase subunit b
VDKLGINLGFLIFQLINFGIILLILSRVAWPRVTKLLDERAERIAQGLEDARAAEAAKANAERERDELLRQARAEGQRVVEEARQRGDEQVKGMLRDAEQEVEQARAQARTQAEQERNRILADTREQIVAMAMAAAERLIGASLSENQQRQIVEGFFSDVPAAARDLGESVTVISALPLTDAEQNRIKSVVGAQQVEYRVEPEILGGLILRAGDKVVDGSVRGDLSSLASRLR